MALTICKFSAVLNWVQTKTQSLGGTSTQSGPIGINVNPTVSSGAANRVYPVTGTLAASATVTIDLSSLTEPAFGEAISPVRSYIILVTGTGAGWKYEPGAANPLSWFLSGTTPAISGNAGAVFVYADTTAQTIDGTHKNIKLTNLSGGATLTYTLVVILGV